jgi:hypothetical protein
MQTILQAAISEQQKIQQCNPPTSEAWLQASDKLRHLVGQLNHKTISKASWDAGKV